MTNKKVIGFTGHRNIIFNSERRQKLATLLQNEKPDIAITGLALGFDQIAAFACIELGIPFIGAIPCDEQSKRWSYNQQFIYKELLQKAYHLEQISQGEYTPEKMIIRDQWIVDNSNKIIAYYDGRLYGGTYHTIRYAYAKGIEVVNMYIMR